VVLRRIGGVASKWKIRFSVTALLHKAANLRFRAGNRDGARPSTSE
jgi:hypothetical protein